MTPVTLQDIKDAVAKKTAESRITERTYQDIVALCNRYLESGKRPLYVYCCVTGTKCAMTAKALFKKRIDECKGDIVCLMTSYISRGSKPASPAKLARQAEKRAKQIARANKPKRIKTAKAIHNREEDSVDPQDLVDPYQHYKILIDGEWRYWWNDPKYQAEWKDSRDNPKQFNLQDWIDMLRNTCHRVDISCAGPCNACPFVYVCSCKCKVVVDRAGKKLPIDPVNLTTFDNGKADMDQTIKRLDGSIGYFNSLSIKS